jgi:hypothetical protein
VVRVVQRVQAVVEDEDEDEREGLGGCRCWLKLLFTGSI